MHTSRLLVVVSTLVVGCSSSVPNMHTGTFIDSAVTGLTYNTETLTGITDAEGRFQYIPGENIVFSIGNLSFPSVLASEQITPVSLSTGSSNPAATATNIARLLQSLDIDGNLDNGISISSDILSTTQINFNVSTLEFENNVDVINLVANSGSTNTALISAVDANAHLNLALAIANTTADIMTFSTGEELLAAGGALLTGAQLDKFFRGQKFISLDLSFDWEFIADGTYTSDDLTGAGQNFMGSWAIENDRLCRTRGDDYVCVPVFALNDAFRLSLNGRDESDGLEGWAIKYAN